MTEITEIQQMKGDIDRLRETAEHIFNHLVEENRTNIFDKVSYHNIIDHLNFIKNDTAKKYVEKLVKYKNTQNQETAISLECMSQDIASLQETICHLLRETFYEESQKEHFCLNYNWMYFGKMDKEGILKYVPQNQEATSQAEEIERMKDDIVRLQDTVYQLLGGAFCQGTESESIFAHFNWMKYGKRYNKGWLNDNGEPHSEDEEDSDDEEETHYFDYKGKYIRENFLKS
jgi:hypothetical protein